MQASKNLNRCLHDIFDDIARQRADAVALYVGGQSYSFRQIQQYSLYIAQLLSDNDYKPGSCIATLLPKTARSLPVILGILRAGCVYIPLDYRYPVKRITHIVTETEASALFCATELLGQLPDTDKTTRILIDDLPEVGDIHVGKQLMLPTVSADQLAYIIYTSGSTGLPKGVMMPHQGFCNVREALAPLEIQTDDRYFQFASLGFAGSLSDIFATLFSGAALYWSEPDHDQDGDYLHRFMTQHAITHTKLPPAVLAKLPRVPIASLKTMMVHGELGMSEYLDFWSRHLKLLNGYGSTEAGACGTIANFSTASDYSIIGHPSCDTRIYVTDKQLQPLKAGQTGEILIDAVGVSRGYLNAPELTASKFIRNPFEDGISPHLYRTGDLGTLCDDGLIRFAGRMDSLTKIDGLRVDVMEVEKALESLDIVRKAYVTTLGQTPENRYLVGFVEPDQELTNDTPTVDFINPLGRKLPPYMMPKRIETVNQIPVNINGKVDRKSLIKLL